MQEYINMWFDFLGNLMAGYLEESEVDILLNSITVKGEGFPRGHLVNFDALDSRIKL